MRAFIRAAVVVSVASAALSLSPATAVGPEDAYVAARDAAVARIKAAVDAEKRGPTDNYGEPILRIEEEARADLETRMRAIIGPVAIRGVEQNGAINLDTLIDGDMGFGMLDGMVYGGPDARTRVIVTTGGLFRRWLDGHKDDVPQSPAAAVKENGFYTQAVLTDSAILRFAELPVGKPAGADFVFAMLAARTQSEVPARANEIFVSLSRGGRVYVSYTREFEPVGPIASCDAVREALVRKSVAAATERGLDEGARREKSDALQTKSETEFMRCFARKASAQNGFAAALRAAEALIARLP